MRSRCHRFALSRQETVCAANSSTGMQAIPSCAFLQRPSPLHNCKKQAFRTKMYQHVDMLSASEKEAEPTPGNLSTLAQEYILAQNKCKRQVDRKHHLLCCGQDFVRTANIAAICSHMSFLRARRKQFYNTSKRKRVCQARCKHARPPGNDRNGTNKEM